MTAMGSDNNKNNNSLYRSRIEKHAIRKKGVAVPEAGSRGALGSSRVHLRWILGRRRPAVVLLWGADGGSGLKDLEDSVGLCLSR